MTEMLTSRRKRQTPKKSDRAPQDRTEFGPRTFDAIMKDMQDGTIPLARITLSDTKQKGLRVVIRNTGLTSYHVHYTIDGSRPYMKIGNYPDMSVTRARALAKTVMSLADKGIDPQAGLHDRLVRELEEQGDKWRP